MNGSGERFYDVFKTSTGWMAAVGSTHGLISVSLPKKTPRRALSHVATKLSGAVYHPGAFDELRIAMEQYFGGEAVTFRGLLDWDDAKAFLRKVLEIVRTIPPGKTMTYKEIAMRLGNPRAARAVARAISRNPLPLVVPCHRVIGTNGELRGYQGGLETKRQLLLLEACTTKGVGNSPKTSNLCKHGLLSAQQEQATQR
jgi:O-6-methylguanine DNA methyltransferase